MTEALTIVDMNEASIAINCMALVVSSFVVGIIAWECTH